MNLANIRMYVQIGATINFGNYQSAKALVGLEVDVPEGSTVDEVRNDLSERLLDLLHDTIDDVKNYIDENHK